MKRAETWERKGDYVEVRDRLHSGKRVLNPIIGWRGKGEDRCPIHRYSQLILGVIAREVEKELVWDFDTEESYLR